MDDAAVAVGSQWAPALNSSMKWISPKAIILSLALGYVLPGLVFWGGEWLAYLAKSDFLNSAVALIGIIWLALLMPLAVGYLAAKHAAVLPYYHALGAICLALCYLGFVYIRARAHADNPWWLLMIYVVTSIPLSFAGAGRAVRQRTP